MVESHRAAWGVGVVLAVVGFAAGVAAERKLVHERLRAATPTEDFGSIRGDAVDVLANDGVKLYVEVDDLATNAPDDLTIVFCHGYSLNQDCWHYQRRDLRPLARLVFADQRAHGRSLRGAANLSNPDQLGQDLGAIIDQVVPEGPILLVGHSMGGMTVMSLAAHRPDLFDSGRIVGVALLGTTAGGMAEAGFGLPKIFATPLHRAAPLAMNALVARSDLVESSRQISNDLGLWLSNYYSFGSHVAPALTAFQSEMVNGTPIDVIAEFLPGLEAHDKYEALANLAEIDTLIMVGATDRMTPPKHSEELAKRLPNAELVILPRTGHMLMLERPEEVNDGLRALVGRVRVKGQ